MTTPENIGDMPIFHFDESAERAVIGSVIINNAMIPVVMARLGDETVFFSQRHRQIWRAILKLSERGVNANQVTIAHEFLDEPDTALYLAHTVSTTPTHVHAEHYAAQVAELAAKRRLLRIAEMMPQAINNAGSVNEAIEHINNQLLQAMPPKTDDTSAKALMDKFMEWWLDPEPASALSTGGKMLDKALNGGLKAGQLVILAADTGKGKTAFACHLVRQTLSADKRVLYYSLEETEDAIAKRLISARARVREDNFESVRRQENTHAYKSVLEAQDWFGERRLNVRYGDGTAAAIALDVEREHAREPVDLVVFDHLQIAANDSNATRNDQLDEATREFKRIALQSKCVVMLLSQFNRNAAKENKRNRPPELSDIRDSGAIAQNADVVGMIHERLDSEGNEHPAEARKLTLYLRKNRYGPRTDIGMEYNAPIHSFKIN